MPHRCTNCDQTFPDGSKEMLSGCPRCGGNKFQYLPAGAAEEPPEEEPPEPPTTPSGSDLDGSVTKKVGKAASTVRDYVSRRRADNQVGDPAGQADSPAEQAPTQSAESRSISTPTGTEDSAEETSTSPQSSTSPETEPHSESQSEATPGARSDATSTSRSEAASEPRSDARSASRSDPSSETSPESSAQEPSRPAPPVDPNQGAEVTTDGKSSEDTAQASARTDMPDASELFEETSPDGDDVSGPPETEGRVVKEPDSPDRPDLETLREELNSQFESIKIIEPGQYELNLMELYDREEHIIALQEDGKYVIEVPESWRDDEPGESAE